MYILLVGPLHILKAIFSTGASLTQTQTAI